MSPSSMARGPLSRHLGPAAMLLLLLLAGLLLVAPARAATSLPGALVSGAWLRANLGQGDLLVLDTSPTPAYAAGHIPGAVHADFFSYASPTSVAANLEPVFQRWGVDATKRLVLLDQGGTFFATRVYFDLVYRGFPVTQIAVLDGGMAKWRADGGAVTKDTTPAPAKGAFRIERHNEDMRVRLPEFLNATGDRRNHAVIEALEPAWHFGGTAFFGRAGHVPHAQMWPPEDLFNADKTFKSPVELQHMLDHLGVRREQQLNTYCGGGMAASVPWFVARQLLNYPKVKLYVESQLEWLQDDRSLPVWSYSAPYLLRDSAWLKSWNNPMVRGYGVHTVSVIDVRAPADYAQGHLPFALNVPSEAMAPHLAQPERLAALLGPAGVNPNHEAVIVTDGGINPRSALAWVALSNVGQRKVSIQLDSIERAAELGVEVTREPTAVGPRKGPTDLSITPVSYTARVPGKPLVVADPARTSGVYPKLYLASGATMPARVPDGGKVVHLPYTQLLQANGQPKAAAEIWSLLEKAGVSRFAEVITFADAPGDAAVNQLLLTLMGFADVKLWLR